MLNYEKMGRGPRTVVVLNDWLGDTSIWGEARAYLDEERFTWVFADVRGYGLSRSQTGSYTVVEVEQDVLELADALDAPRFAIVGHSMTTLVALHLAQQHPERIDRAVVLTPPPPNGLGLDDEAMSQLRQLGHADDETRMGALRMLLGTRLSPQWLKVMAARWRRADPDAIAGYVSMFARQGLPHPNQPIDKDVLLVTGEEDTELMRCEPLTRALSPLCPRLVVKSITDSGHYPMRETPPLLAAILERWLAGEEVA